MLPRMNTDRLQINLRVDRKLRALIEQLRREQDPIPSVSELIRQALVEKAKMAEAKRREGWRDRKGRL